MSDTILEADDKPLKKLKDDKAIIERAMDQAEKALEAVKDNNDRARKVLEFAYAEDQWTAEDKAEREGRPCLTINKLPANADKVEGDLRQNKIAIKIIPWNGSANAMGAKIRAGIIRNIEEISDAEYHYVTAGMGAAVPGKGVLRAYTKYVDDDTFDQELRVMAVDNPLSVVFDPEAKMPDKSDANYAFIFDSISSDEYKRRFPKKNPIEIDSESPQKAKAWAKDEDIRIAEYFLKVPEKRTLYKIKRMVPTEGGEREEIDVVDELPKGVEILSKRQVDSYKIEWRLIDGKQTLEGPIEWPGRKYLPLVEVPGKKVNIDGEVKYRGMFNYALDPQKNYNYWASASTEVVALAPKSPWLITGPMLKGYEEIWAKAHLKNYPYMPYSIDPANPQAMPKREQPGAIPMGMIDERRLAGDEIKDTVGRHEASLGMRSNETSGKAIAARAARSDLGDFAYSDNLALAVKHLGRILLDAMPRVYDTERLIRIVDEEDREEFVALNQAMADGGILNDMSVGRYECKVTVGPHFNSRQAEALDGMLQFTQYNPKSGMMIGDLVAEASNWPNKEKVAARFKKMAGIEDGKEDPKKQAMMQQQIQQAVMQAVEQYKKGPENKKAEAEAMEAQAQADEAKVKMQEAQINVQIKQQELEIKREELAKKVQETRLVIEKREQVGKTV